MLYALDLSEPVSCVMFGRMMQRNGWHRNYTHKNGNHLLVFVISGTADFLVDGKRASLCAGDVLVIPAGVSYSANTDSFCEYYFFRFVGRITPASEIPSYSVIGRSFSFSVPEIENRTVVFSEKTCLQEDYQKFYQSIIACVEHNASGTFSQRLALDLELSKILLMLSLIQERKRPDASCPMVLEKMLSFIRGHLTEPLTTSVLCKYCGISASYAARLFRKYKHTTVTEYILGEKLYYACELMNSTGMNISQIAAYLGFCDVYYFSKCFKAKFGKAPTQLYPRN